MKIYRRKRGSKVWHWYKNCSKYPRTADIVAVATGAVGKLCRECQAKERQGNCKKPETR